MLGRLLFQDGREPGSRLQHGQLTGDEERLDVAIAVGVGRIGLGRLVVYREVDQELRGPDPDFAVEEGFAILAVTAGPARADEGVFETVAAARSVVDTDPVDIRRIVERLGGGAHLVPGGRRFETGGFEEIRAVVQRAGIEKVRQAHQLAVDPHGIQARRLEGVEKPG